MKLRDKKTGIIGELHFEPDKEYCFTVVTEDPADVMMYKKLADLYVEWEDYEEPKKYWCIANNGDVDYEIDGDFVYDRECEQIGNYFETKEKAEQAVEKLKAWKRLKDKGFKFDSWSAGLGKNKIYTIFWSHNDGEFDLRKDLNLLFGGEE